MSDSISAVGGSSQAIPVSLVNTQARDNAAKPQAATNVARADVGGFRGVEHKIGAVPNEGELARTDKDATKGNNEKNALADKASPTVEEATETLKEYLNNLPSEFEFKFDKEAGRQILKVVNPVTREVIRQFPPEDLLKLSKRLREMGAGSNDSGFLLDDMS